MTPYQRQIIAWARSMGGRFTKREAVAEFGHRYYTNAAFHVGNALSAMVKREYLIRDKPGHYRIGKGKKQAPTAGDTQQPTLF